jgi:hypothetical protein
MSKLLEDKDINYDDIFYISISGSGISEESDEYVKKIFSAESELSKLFKTEIDLPGKFKSSQLFDLNIMEVGSELYNWLSGLPPIDFAYPEGDVGVRCLMNNKNLGLFLKHHKKYDKPVSIKGDRDYDTFRRFILYFNHNFFFSNESFMEEIHEAISIIDSTIYKADITLSVISSGGYPQINSSRSLNSIRRSVPLRGVVNNSYDKRSSEYMYKELRRIRLLREEIL